MKATPKKGIAVSEEEDHPAGLWIDSEAFQKINGRVIRDLRKETFELYPRYLELAALVLGPAEELENSPPNERKRSKRKILYL